MGELMDERFTSFEEARRFLAEAGELESFLDRCTEEDSVALRWAVPVARDLIPAIERLQERLSGLEGVATVPSHFLHLMIARTGVADVAPDAAAAGRMRRLAEDAWHGVPAFGVALAGVYCFGSEIVVRVDGDGPRGLLRRLAGSGADLPGTSLEQFLPHVAVAITTARIPAAGVRAALEPVAEEAIGHQIVEEVVLCAVPFARESVLSPWTELGRVRLGSTDSVMNRLNLVRWLRLQLAQPSAFHDELEAAVSREDPAEVRRIVAGLGFTDAQRRYLEELLGDWEASLGSTPEPRGA